MRKIFFILLFLLVKQAGFAQQVFAPVPVTKTATNKIYIHLMPWFETKATNNGTWGQHWRMANKNPDIVDTSGRRQIASYYYPLTGPYASGDTNIIEYQLLLMKLAGVDAVAVDWPGTMNVYDYAKNKQNAEALINRLDKVGLQFTIVYEDNNLALGSAPNRVAQAQADMIYLRDNYFNRGTYAQVNNAPLLLDFGPQAITNAADWTNVFSVFTTKPTFLPLWGDNHVNAAGTNGKGEYSWIYSTNNYLYNYYQNHTVNGVRMGSAYIGFRDYYAAGGWGSGIGFTITPSVANFQETLDKAFFYNLPHIQVATWNDYGEGTMIEPTREFGYGCLTYLQQKLGVTGLSQSDLELVFTLYQQRVQYAGNATEQARLNQVFYYIVSLQMDLARDLLMNTPASSLPLPWRNTDIGIVSAGGSAGFQNNIFTVKGSGADIYGTADAFHYVYQQTSEDVTITAKVNSIENTNVWAKAGLMIRDGISAGAANAAIVITPGNGINFQYRSSTSGATVNTGGNVLTAPYWLQLKKNGNSITARYSPDSISWTTIGSASIPFSSSFTAGMLVTSHNDGTTATGSFSNVSLTHQPVISSFAPVYGVTGSTITVKGKFFSGINSMSFGGMNASSFTIISDTVITAIVGNGQSGNVDAIAPWGTASATGFVYQLCSFVSTNLTSTLTGTSYQWQVDTGSGFVDISNNANYAGVQSKILQLNNIISGWNGYKYRCVADGNFSDVLVLKFTNRWTGEVNTAWENAENWSCGVVPDANSDVLVNSGNIVISSNVTVRSLSLQPGVTITVNNNAKVVINH